MATIPLRPFGSLHGHNNYFDLSHATKLKTDMNTTHVEMYVVLQASCCIYPYFP